MPLCHSTSKLGSCGLNVIDCGLAPQLPQTMQLQLQIRRTKILCAC